MKKVILILLSIVFFCPLSYAEKVSRVVDGDTILLDSGKKIRMLGIDSPESVHPFRPVECYGKESSNYLKKIIEGQDVELEYDTHGRYDRFGRTLAYVYRKSDKVLLNLKLVRLGYAKAYLRFPFSKKDDFVSAEKYAIEHKLGLWEACRG